MSGNQWSDPDFESDEDGNDGHQQSDGPAALRQAYKELQKRYKALEAEVKPLRTQSRKTSVADLLGKAQVKNAAKVASLYPSDAEATEDAVKTWVAEFADVFNIQTESAGDGTSDGSVAEGSEQQIDQPLGYTPEDVAALQQVAQASQGSAPTPGKIAAQMAEVQAAKTPAELAAVMAKYGAGTIQGTGG